MSSDHWDLVNKRQDLIALLTMICDAAHQHDEIKGGTMQVAVQDLRLYFYGFQKQHQSLIDYYKLFRAQVEVINVHRGCFQYHPGLYQKKLAELKAHMTLSPRDAEYDDALNVVKQKAKDAQGKEYKAALFLRIANEKHFSGLKLRINWMTSTS